MKSARNNRRRVTAPRSQRGVVLLIALIILVAMTLAGIGMMRSVDTGGMIAGNMAFRQATMQASDAGIVAAFNQLVLAANSSVINEKHILRFSNGQPCPVESVASPLCAAGVVTFPGYFSAPINACEVTGGCTAAQNAWWSVNANWANASAPITVTDPTNGSTIATVSYLIHRMCLLPNEKESYQPFTMPSGNQLCQSDIPPCQKNCTGYKFYFRITSRSVGVRNTVTYTQQIAKIDMQ